MKLFDHKNEKKNPTFIYESVFFLREWTPKTNKRAASKISVRPFEQFNLLSRISQHFKASALNITRMLDVFSRLNRYETLCGNNIPWSARVFGL